MATSPAADVTALAVDATQDAADASGAATPTALPCPVTPTGTPGPPPAFPQPPCEDTWPEAWIDAGMDKAPSINVDLAAASPDTAVVHPYGDGDWAAIVHGTQGLTHVEVVIVVSGSEVGPGDLKTSVLLTGRFGCAVASDVGASTVYLKPAGDGTWSNAKQPKYLVFQVPGDLSWQLCGRWLELRVVARLPDGRWGEARRRLRLWDTLPTQP